jgi:TetR/AcrR family transcriptional regulator, tetracycline repressor protein
MDQLSDGITGLDGRREVPIGVWFATMVTEEQLPSLHRVLPALARADCVQDFAFALDLLIAGLRAAATEHGHRAQPLKRPV